jgi:hypothetical protein
VVYPFFYFELDPKRRKKRKEKKFGLSVGLSVERLRAIAAIGLEPLRLLAR